MVSSRAMACMSMAVGLVATSAWADSTIVLNQTSQVTDGFVYELLSTASADELASFSPGMNQSLGVGRSGGDSPREIKAFVRFDLASQGIVAVDITSATLTLTNAGTSFIKPPASGVTDPTQAQPVTVGLRPISTPWSTASVSYNPGPSPFSPAVNVGQPVQLDPLAEQHNVTGVGQTITFDITSLVQGWVANPATNNGLSLVTTSAPVFVTASSSWAVANFFSSNGAAGPSLAITVVPEPMSLSALAFAAGTLLRRRR